MKDYLFTYLHRSLQFFRIKKSVKKYTFYTSVTNFTIKFIKIIFKSTKQFDSEIVKVLTLNFSHALVGVDK